MVKPLYSLDVQQDTKQSLTDQILLFFVRQSNLSIISICIELNLFINSKSLTILKSPNLHGKVTTHFDDLAARKAESNSDSRWHSIKPRLLNIMACFNNNDIPNTSRCRTYNSIYRALACSNKIWV